MGEKQNRFMTVLMATVVSGALLAGTSVHAPAQEGMDFPDLVGGIKAIEGCLGVETAETQSGKQVIFAWFEDKEAVLRWYYSDMHKGVQDQFFPGRRATEPLEGIPDDVGPVMAIASITMSNAAHFEQTNLPISQIAIELYTPLTGGIYLGGRFAPDELIVKGLREVGMGKE